MRIKIRIPKGPLLPLLGLVVAEGVLDLLINNKKYKDILGIATRGQYCSQLCYHKHPYSKERKQQISDFLKRAYNEGRR